MSGASPTPSRGARSGSSSIAGDARNATIRRSSPAAVGAGVLGRAAREIAGDGSEGAMDQDAHGAFRATEDAGDLGGRHLLDEAQDDRPPSIGRQATNGLPGGRRLVANGRSALDIER